MTVDLDVVYPLQGISSGDILLTGTGLGNTTSGGLVLKLNRTQPLFLGPE